MTTTVDRIALFITELAPGGVRRVTTFVMDLLAAVPSVVFGLWASPCSFPPHRASTSRSARRWRSPGLGRTFDDPYNGKPFLAAGFIVALMITPITTSITRDVFDTTPRGQLVIGSGSQISAQLFSSGDALASRIANASGEATGTWRSGLVGLGVALSAMTFLFNLAATSIVSRGTRKWA